MEGNIIHGSGSQVEPDEVVMEHIESVSTEHIAVLTVGCEPMVGILRLKLFIKRFLPLTGREIKRIHTLGLDAV